MAHPTAFEILYREYYPRVYGLCFRLLSVNELAEDATQEAFMRAYKNFRNYDVEKPFWQWIAAIANNHCVDVLRRQHKQGELFGSEQAELDQAPDRVAAPLNQLIAQQHAQALNKAIAALPAKYRVPLVMAYFSQMSYDAIAEQLDIQRSHVGVLLLRGKERLRRVLDADADRVGQE